MHLVHDDEGENKLYCLVNFNTVFDLADVSHTMPTDDTSELTEDQLYAVMLNKKRSLKCCKKLLGID